MTRIEVKAGPKFIEWVKQQKADVKKRHEESFAKIAANLEMTEKLREMNKNIKKTSS